MKIVCRFVQMQDQKIKKIILDQQQFIIAQFQQTKKKINQRLTKTNAKTAEDFTILKKKITTQLIKFIHETRKSQHDINLRLKKQNLKMKKMNMRQRNYQTIMKNERLYRFHQSIHHIYAFKRIKEKINMKWIIHFHILKHMKEIFILSH